MLPAGKYYVGDLCYVMTDAEWDEICAMTLKDGDVLDGEFTLSDGRRFAMYSTLFGDGEYNDRHGRCYPVDSGSIGCIEVSGLSSEDQANAEDNNIIEFDQPFDTEATASGVIRIGHISIPTASQNDAMLFED